MTTYFLGCDMERAEVHPFLGGEVGVYSTRCPGKTTSNEDAAALVEVDPTRGVLVVADGMGGGPAGEAAAERAVRAMATSASASEPTASVREAILDGLEAANRSVPQAGAGAATTLAIAEIDGDRVRAYHVGDSCVLVVGQRGRLKHVTVPHSPTGYAVEAGIMDEEEALDHDERHLVSNVVGSAEMKIEIGPTLKLAARDTVLLATDGVFDNLRTNEICDAIRVGSMESVLARLITQVRDRMASTTADEPAKPDDWTFVVFRPTRSGERGRSA